MRALSGRGPWLHFVVWLALFAGCFVSPQTGIIATASLALGLGTVTTSIAVTVARSSARLRLFLVGLYVGIAGICVLAAIAYGAYLRQSGPIGADVMRAIAQTDLFEAFGYVVASASWLEGAAVVIIGGLLVVTFQAILSGAIQGTRAPRILWVAPALGISLMAAGGVPVLKPILGFVAEYKAEAAQFKAHLAKRRTKTPSGVQSNFDGTIIVIIGESTSRRHMGLYGYIRDTTPLLSQKRHELNVFRDIISPHSHTDPVLTRALTLAGTRDDLSYFDEGAYDIVAVANAAGFETFWFSNQNEYGIWDNSVSILGKSADNVRFFSPSLGVAFRRALFDGTMLPAIEGVLSSARTGRRIIFVHTFGSHWPYCWAYPPEFEVYSKRRRRSMFGKAKPTAQVNCYDNAVRYVDWTVNSVIDIAAKVTTPTAVLYLSDHGDAPLLGTGHDSANQSAYHIEIPFILWVNEPFEQRYPRFAATAHRNVARPYSIERLFHALSDLMGIGADFVDRSHSIFSDEFVEQERTAFDGRVRYDRWSTQNDYRQNARVFVRDLGSAREMVWAHRNNSLGKLAESMQIFSGVEIDLQFDRTMNRFTVSHDATSPATGLTLEDMLAAMKRRPAMRLWLDWKNASPENIEQAISRLNELDLAYGLRERALIETGSNAVFPEIGRMSMAGYLHGYYLPTDRVLRCMAECNTAAQAELAATIVDNIEIGGFDAVTYDWRLRPFVVDWLTDFIAAANLRQFSWDTSVNASASDVSPKSVADRVIDAELDALLVVLPSRFNI